MSWEGLNRRRFPRAKFPCLVKLIVDGREGEALLTHTENISSGGVCVIIRKHIVIFAPMLLEIDLMDGEDLICCRGRAVWVVRRKATELIKPAFYHLGVEFVDIKEIDRNRMERAVEQLVRSTQKARL